jgi:2-dehydropantoate 2-reductase
MGAGAVGCYVGGRLASAGEDVVFIARGDQLQALRDRGLRLIEPDRTDTLYPVEVTSDPAQAGLVDYILLCVKLFDTHSALKACRPMLGPQSAVITLQNGIDSVTMVDDAVGSGRAIGGAVYVVATLVEPGVVMRTGDWARIEIAEPSGTISTRASVFADACVRAGIECIVRNDLERLSWAKFVLLSATSATTALTRQPIGYVRGDADVLEFARRCIQETLAVARARGVELPDELEAAALRKLCEAMPADAKASQLVDLERGKPLELDYLSGAIHRLGAAHGVPTPVHSTVYAALRPFLHGSKGRAKLMRDDTL